MDEDHLFDPDRDVEMQEAAPEAKPAKKKGPTPEQLTAIKAAIQNAGDEPRPSVDRPLCDVRDSVQRRWRRCSSWRQP